MKAKPFSMIAILCLFLLFVLFGCQKDKGKVPEIKLQPVFEWGGAEVEGASMIGGISDFIVSSKNEIIALDIGLCHVFFFDQKGNLITKLLHKIDCIYF